MNYFDERRRIIIEASRPKTDGELQDELRPIAPDVRIVSGPEPGVLSIVHAPPESDTREVIYEHIRNRINAGVRVIFDDALQGTS